MIPLKKGIQKVYSIFIHQTLIFRVYKALPWPSLIVSHVIEEQGRFHVVHLDVVEQSLCAQYARDFLQQVKVTHSMKERLLPENHRGEHDSDVPHVQATVVVLVIEEKFRGFDEATGYSDTILGAGDVELSQIPAKQPQLEREIISCSSRRISRELTFRLW